MKAATTDPKPPSPEQAFEWLAEHGRTLWDHPAMKCRAGLQGAFGLSAYSVNGHVVILQVFSERQGFEIYMPVSESNKIDQTMAALANRTRVASLHRNPLSNYSQHPVLNNLTHLEAQLHDHVASLEIGHGEDFGFCYITRLLQDTYDVIDQISESVNNKSAKNLPRESAIALVLEIAYAPSNIPATIPQSPQTATKQLSQALTCPHCDYDGKEDTQHGGTFRYLSDQTAWREIIRWNKKRMIVEGRSDTYDDDQETNDRIECRACLKQFPLPTGLDIEFI
jgi:hypothetical protein